MHSPNLDDLHNFFGTTIKIISACQLRKSNSAISWINFPPLLVNPPFEHKSMMMNTNCLVRVIAARVVSLFGRSIGTIC